MNELREKLARWRGFKRIYPAYIDNSVDPPILYPARWEFRDKDGDIIYMATHTPDFPKSLDACVEWLVPVLNKKLDRHISLYQSTNGWTCDIGLGDVAHEDKDLALALCLAIEKLIDGEK